MKFKHLFLLLFTGFVLSCSNEEVTDDLQSQIDDLEATIETLQGTITTLQGQLTSANTSNSTLATQLTQAQAALTEARNLVNAATTDITALQERLAFVQNALAGIDYSDTVQLAATGDVSQQSPTEAAQTIYGRWNVGGAAARSSCAFDFIEFSEDNYLMTIILPDGEKGTVFGEYIIQEGTDGTVSSVDLMFDAGATDIRVARLTNINVVVDTDDELNATFDVVLELPEALEICDAQLSGSVQATKPEPVQEATTATAISNHAKIVGEWDVASINTSDGETLETLLANFCLDYDDTTGQETPIEGCTPPTGGVINFSTFGTYSITVLSADGSPVDTQIEDWGWKRGSDQTVLQLGFGGDDVDDYDIVELSETRLVMTTTYMDWDINEATGTETEVTITETVTLNR